MPRVFGNQRARVSSAKAWPASAPTVVIDPGPGRIAHVQQNNASWRPTTPPAWQGSYSYAHAMGGDPSTLSDLINSEPVSTAAAIAMTYHGYKRTGSLVWALVYGLAGKWFPIEAVPIAVAQGFGQKKSCP